MSFLKFSNVQQPLSNVNGNFVNKYNSHNSAGFTDTINPKTVNPNALPEPASNIQAAKSFIPCNLKGGRRKKNISNMYKMRRTHKRHQSRRYRTRSRTRARARLYKRRRTMRGGKWGKKGGGLMPNYPAGYSQYQNNLPNTPAFSVGAKLSANESALANPPPINKLSNCVNCIDNYNHNINKGFPSRGWW